MLTGVARGLRRVFRGPYRYCLFAVAAAFAPGIAGASASQWNDKNAETPAAVRSITLSNGRLLGGRIGRRVEAWSSGDGGATWTRTGTVAGPASGVAYGDCDFLSDGSGEVYCAFRQHKGAQWRVTVCRSEDGGANWTYDSTVDHTSTGRFLGAPCLWFSRNGDLQCYYDSELAAADAGHPGYQWINEASRPRHANGQAWKNAGVACRPANPGMLARDGMASVCNLDGSDMMLVCEGVDPAKPSVNCLFSILSHDNGETWDYASRAKVWAPIKDGVQFNAYCPWAIRYGDGSVGVVFCTDDDFTSPSPDNAPPGRRNAHVKFIRMAAGARQWSGLTTVDAGKNTMYAPGLFEVSPNHLICSIDSLAGYEVVKDNAGVP